MSQSQVEDVLNFYWKTGVYEVIREIPHFSIYIPNLGTFELIRKKIPLLIDFFKRKQDELYVSRLTKVQQMLLNEYDRRNKKRELKKQFYENLEKQMEDTGGNMV
jgi:hypothetical protein